MKYTQKLSWMIENGFKIEMGEDDIEVYYVANGYTWTVEDIVTSELEEIQKYVAWYNNEISKEELIEYVENLGKTW